MALRIVETAFGPFLIDEENTRQGPPTRLELLAEELGVDADTYRDLLRDEIERRRVACAGDGPDVTPVAHRHEI